MVDSIVRISQHSSRVVKLAGYEGLKDQACGLRQFAIAEEPPGSQSPTEGHRRAVSPHATGFTGVG